MTFHQSPFNLRCKVSSTFIDVIDYVNLFIVVQKESSFGRGMIIEPVGLNIELNILSCLFYIRCLKNNN